MTDTPVSEEAFGEDPLLTREVNGRTLKFFHPTNVQFAAYMARIQRLSSDTERVLFMMEFVGSLLDPDDEAYWWDQITSRGSGITMEMIMQLAGEIVEGTVGKDSPMSSTSTVSDSNTTPSSTGNAR